MIPINKDTKFCISISEKSGNFGTTLHNSLYKELNLDFIYKSFSIKNIRDAIIAVRTLNIKGCSVSMPFKEDVIYYLDEIDELSKSIGAVNTIVNNDGKLKGYNTDVYGAIESIKYSKVKKTDSIFMLGSGGAAKAYLFALKKLGIKKITLANRTKIRLKKLEKISKFDIVDWKNRGNFNADVLINATSVGMYPYLDKMEFKKDNILNSKIVIDVVVNPLKSKLIIEEEKLKKKTCPGYVMSMYQAKRQFRLYTGVNPSLSLIESKIKLLLK